MERVSEIPNVEVDWHVGAGKVGGPSSNMANKIIYITP